ncbi:MAG: hypothetical protein WCP92_04435 [bacterium]
MIHVLVLISAHKIFVVTSQKILYFVAVEVVVPVTVTFGVVPVPATIPIRSPVIFAIFHQMKLPGVYVHRSVGVDQVRYATGCACRSIPLP